MHPTLQGILAGGCHGITRKHRRQTLRSEGSSKHSTSRSIPYAIVCREPARSKLSYLQARSPLCPGLPPSCIGQPHQLSSLGFAAQPYSLPYPLTTSPVHRPVLAEKIACRTLSDSSRQFKAGRGEQVHGTLTGEKKAIDAYFDELRRRGHG